MLTATEIEQHVGGRFFGVTFIKRSDGQRRHMRCRLGVTAFLTGKGAAYSFEEKKLMCVWDLDAGGYRTIPLDGIITLKCGNITLRPNGELGRVKAKKVRKPAKRPEPVQYMLALDQPA